MRSSPDGGHRRPNRGELNAAVTKALVKIQSEQLGRGPANASTFYHDNVLVTLMHDVLSHAEKILGQNGHHTTVSDWRETLQTALEPDFRPAVERLTGRTVIAFISANHLEVVEAVDAQVKRAELN